MPAKRVSRTEYAAHRGVNRQAVDRAIQTSRIAGAVGPDGLIDVAVADRLWSELTQPLRGGRRQPSDNRQASSNSLPLEYSAMSTAHGAAIPPIHISRAERDGWNAKLAEIETAAARGELMTRGDLSIEALAIRESILAIPGRLAPVLAGLTDPAEVRRRMAAEIEAALEEISRQGWSYGALASELPG